MQWCERLSVAVSVLSLVACALAVAEEINPCPRALLRAESLKKWTFEAGDAGWAALHECTVATAKGVLKITSTGSDPYLRSPAFSVEGPIVVRLRMRCAGGGDGQIFWATAQSPNFDQARSAHFKLIHDREWHDCE